MAQYQNFQRPRYKVFTQKELKKDFIALLELHKRVVKTYLVSKSLNFSTRNKFFRLYDMEITEDNILDFYYIPMSIFVKCLVLNRLDKVRSYRQHPISYYKSKKRKKSKK